MRLTSNRRMRLVPLFLIAIACGGPSQSAKPIGNQAVPAAPRTAGHTRGLEFRVVDSSSAAMEKIFAHVGYDNGTPTDPMALSAGITVDVEAWADPIEGSKRHQEYHLVAKDRATLERYVTTIAAKDLALSLPKDREFGYEQSDTGTWRTYVLERTASLDGSTVANATQSVDPTSGRVVVMLDFDATGAKALAELTKRITGQKLAIIFNGVIKSAPIINNEIAGGHASITMGGVTLAEQETQAQQLVTALKSK
jgi:hypothetical protein